MNVIIGAGLAGLAASYHLGHRHCQIIEASGGPFGHARAHISEGFTWDQGPHISFTKQEYVRGLFAESVRNEYCEFDVRVSNYYHGTWIEHPAQYYLHAVPEPLRAQCIADLRAARSAAIPKPVNYQQWLTYAFGATFAQAFAGCYTEKYWTVPPHKLGLDWIGERVSFPSVDEVIAGAQADLPVRKHYIQRARYPTRGGFQSFAQKMAGGASIRFNATVAKIFLKDRFVRLHSGEAIHFTRLINTIPLPVFVELCAGVPHAVLEAARALLCTELLLVNVAAPHPVGRPENWIYVYDRDKLCTRVSITESFSRMNAPGGAGGIQCEVYSSRERPFAAQPRDIEMRVVEELREMRLLEREPMHCFSKKVPFANIVFTSETKEALEVIWAWLEGFGLARENDDTDPLPHWAAAIKERPAALAFAGRFGQWKYFWSDDCIMRSFFWQ